MDISKLEELLKGQPQYRLNQAREAVFKLLIDDWSQAVGLPKDLREILAKSCPLGINAKLISGKRGDSAKALITLDDGMQIETVLMRHESGRNTVCVSSQVGCPMGCAFCATGKLGFKRNLTAAEIVQQAVYFARLLKKENQRLTNIVFMGMGEPFMNYDNVMAAVRTINDSSGLGIGARHISISTVGVIEGIEKLIDEPLQVNLAISLHAPNDELRTRLIPANKKYPLEAIVLAVLRYTKNTNRRVMFEYIMVDEVNDSDENARQLAQLIKRFSLKLAFVNLIRYNPTGVFNPTPAVRAARFKKILDDEKVETTERYRFGTEVKAACGQLAAGALPCSSK